MNAPHRDGAARYETAETSAGRRVMPAWRCNGWQLLTVLYFAIVFTILLAPLAVVVVSSFSAPTHATVVVSYVPFPPERLTLQWYTRIPTAQMHALGVSFALGLAVALQSQTLGEWRSADAIGRWLDELPHEANSGDIYALRP